MMNVTANEYADDIETIQVNRAQHIIESIPDFVANDKLEILVDIGCGSGKLTSLITERLICEKVIGIDIDNNMIDYANANNSNNKSIEFLEQNIDCDWNELRPELKALKGRVSLVFSNYAIMWINNKEKTVKNIYRLLANGGKLFATLKVVPDPLNGMIPSINDYMVQHYLRIAPKEQQLSDWLNALTTIGLIVENSELVSFSYTFTQQVYRNTFEKLFLKWFSVYADWPQEKERQLFIDNHADLITHGHERNAMRAYIDEQTVMKMIEHFGHHFTTGAVKPFHRQIV